MRWFRVRSRYSTHIEAAEVIRETDKQVVILETYHSWPSQEIKTKERRVTKLGEYFPTFAEAQQYVIDRLDAKIDGCLETIKAAQKDRIRVQNMEEPK